MGIICEINRLQQTLEGRQKKGHRKGILGPKKWHSVEFTGFSFKLMCIRHGNEKASNKKCQTVRKNQRLTNSFPFLAKGPEKEDLCKTESVRQYWITSLLQRTKKKETNVVRPHAWLQKLSGEPRLLSWEDC